MNYQDHEHVTALIEAGYSENDIAETIGHSIEWVQKARTWNEAAR